MALAPGLRGPSTRTHLTKRVEGRCEQIHARPLASLAQPRRTLHTERIGGRAEFRSACKTVNALKSSCAQEFKCCGAPPTFASQLILLMLRCTVCCLPRLRSSFQCRSHAVRAVLRGAITPSPSTMLHADVDEPASRVPCVCSNRLLLLLYSTDVVETQPKAAVHRPRTRAAALCVVGVAQGLSLASSALLLVVLRGACGGLGRLGSAA